MTTRISCLRIGHRRSTGAAILRASLLLVLALPLASGVAAQGYLPGAGEAWERRTAEQVGMDPAALAAAVASVTEWNQPRDLLEMHAATFGREPMGEAVGPFTVRGPATGLVIRHGYIVAEWGDPSKVDPTYSVTKSFLSSTVGLAYDRGLIRDVNDRLRDYFAPVVALKGPPGGMLVATGENAPVAAAAEQPRTAEAPAGARAAYDSFEVIQPFESELNSRITWDHLLRQTSDWEGTLWGKPDWADRPARDLEAHRNRVHNEPGSSWTYNDVRVNLLALAALNVWRRPLPEVLKEHLMDPIGASGTWRWFGYDNSWVVLDGKLVQSVSGGAHWGGGMWISAYDMGRFGLLTLNRGRWGDRQILSEEWVGMALKPTPVRDSYGFMNWYLTPGATNFRHVGTGNTIYVYPDQDLVVVMRWVGNSGAVVRQILDAIEP